MEGEYIIITIISTLGGLCGLMLINHNWFKRQEIKYKYDIKRYRLKKNFNNLSSSTTFSSVPSTEPSLKSSAIGALLKNIPAEQLEGLIEKFLPDAAESGEGSPLEQLIAYGLSEDGKPLRDMVIKGLTEKSSSGNKGETGY